MAIVVEDGTGLATADSYLSIAGMTAYVAAYMRSSTVWSAASTTEQEEWLREGTQALNALFARRWRGIKVLQTQSLDFPRIGIVDDDGFSVLSTTVPVRIANACAEMTWRAANVGGVDLATGDSTKLIADNASAMIASESVKVGAIGTSTTYLGGKSGQTDYRKISLMLTGLITAAGTVRRG